MKVITKFIISINKKVKEGEKMQPLKSLSFCLIWLICSVAHAENTEPVAEVVSTKTAIKKQVGGGKAIIQIFKEGQAAFIGRLTVAPNGAVPLHKDPTEEYLLIEQGSGTITIDGVSKKVNVGDLIYMPANAEVSFKNSAKPLVALQIFAGPQSARKYDSWETIPTTTSKE
jgi:mannose-6-phosphate isomerase-like protein (cupin superfamily)